jgi:hypothetical protein
MNPIIEAAILAEGRRQHGHLDLAIKLLDGCKRKVTINRVKIETWWDRHSRNWVTISDFPDGHEESSYDGEKRSAATAFVWAIISAAKLKETR